MLVFALLWLGVVLAVRHLRPVRPPAAADTAAALRAELAALPADIERQVEEFRRIHAPEPASDPLAEADRALGAPWVSVVGPDAITFRPVEPSALRWPDLIGAVEKLERVPGLTVREVRIGTTGSRTVRQFGPVEITAQAIPAGRPLNPVRRAEPGDGPGSGREAAGLRETGSGPLAAGRPPPPPATPADGSGFRPGAASGPATLAPAAIVSIPPTSTP